MKSRIVFDDKNIRVIWQEGKSDYVLVTFGDRYMMAEGSRFFADVPAQKMDLTCLGFMAKAPNWFPLESVSAAIPHATTLMANYSRRVLYGGSMGGYAAIKYSRKLQATSVIALCPQWSIDKDECEGVNPGWQDFFTPVMRGMGISSEDVDGHVMVLGDSFDKKDRFHFGKIRECCADYSFVNLPFVGHNVTPIVAGTENLRSLIGGSMMRDMATLRTVVRRTRRYSAHRIVKLFERAVKLKPNLAKRVIYGMKYSSKEFALLVNAHAVTVADWVVRNYGGTAAVAFIERSKSQVTEPTVYIQLSIMAAHIQNKTLCLHDWKGLPIQYDFGEARCVSRQNPYNLDLTLNMVGDSVTLQVKIAGHTLPLSVDANGFCVSPSSRDVPSSPAVFKATCPERGNIAFQHAGYYLSSERDGRVRATKSEALAWEKFSLRVV